MANAHTAADLSALRNLAARNPDGTGNNLANPDWGTAHSHFLRVTENSYPDGIGVEWDLPVNNTGLANPPNMVGTMPSPRDITDRLMAQPAGRDVPSKAGINEFFQFFGQFLTHDVAEAELVGPAVPADGPPLFLDGLPFPFNRTPGEIEDGVRQQSNDETSYLDLSTVYGSSQAIENLLRGNVSEGGATVKSARLLDGGASPLLLPTHQEVANHHGISVAAVQAVLDPNAFAPNGALFAAGDNRVNQQPHLITHQAMWKNNHNWHVDRLEASHPDWTEAQLFEAARALNEAEWQNVVYSEYMAELIGPNLARYNGYKPNVDASVINEWTTVAFRFGHDQSSNDLRALTEEGKAPAGQPAPLSLGDAFALGPDGVRSEDALNWWVRGQLARTTQEIDGKVVEGNRNLLFGLGAVVDLEVFDIQRGRDHGVGRYNDLREGLGLKAYKSIDQFAAQNKVSKVDKEALKDIYGADGIDKVDSIVGGLFEKEARGSQLGETFTLLNVLQFQAFRDGDRFYFENRFKSNPDLIDAIKETTLADIIARNTGIDHVYHEAFAAHLRKGGDDGNDNINGSKGKDLLIGFDGDDRINGRASSDDLYGDDGNDKLYGWTGDDFLYGGAGDDLLRGDAGADHLFGGTGDNEMRGGAGRDVFHIASGSGVNEIDDFRSGQDRIDLSQVVGFDDLRDVKAAADQERKDTVIDLGDGGTLVLDHVKMTKLKAHDFHYSDDFLIA